MTRLVSHSARRLHARVAAGLLAVRLTTPLAVQAQATFREAIDPWLQPANPSGILPRHERERLLLNALYDHVASPLWSRDGIATSQARAAITAISAAETDGLRAADYDVDALRSAARTLTSADMATIAGFDALLSRALLRFALDLHRGRVDPLTLGYEIAHAPDESHVLDILRRVPASTDVAGVLQLASPRYAAYAALREALRSYRVLAAEAPPVLSLTRRPVRRGDTYNDAAVLTQRLAALGDLRDEDVAKVPTGTFDGPLVAAVAAFQQRHGLEPDSVLGAETLAQLRVPLSRRITQLELAMERWRWMPDTLPSRAILVNIPRFTLSAYTNDPRAMAPALQMKVIVGQARGNHATPTFSATMREVVFRPWWDVPPRIARNELVPLIRRRPGYLEREQLEIVGTGAAPSSAMAATPANLARVSAGTLRLRQRPGSGNALGLVKLLFPNRHNVYLHDTPTKPLFARARRDFSHGCMRAERPAALAAFVLNGQAGWDSTGIADAMQGNRTLHVATVQPTTVFVTYTTAVAEGDTVSFFADLYGRDEALLTRLASRR